MPYTPMIKPAATTLAKIWRYANYFGIPVDHLGFYQRLMILTSSLKVVGPGDYEVWITLLHEYNRVLGMIKELKKSSDRHDDPGRST